MFANSAGATTAVSSRAASRVSVLQNGTRLPLDTITAPGAYVCNWSGHLLRVPARSLTPEGPPALNIIGAEPLVATKISDDPDLPLREARRLAGNFGLSVGF